MLYSMDGYIYWMLLRLGAGFLPQHITFLTTWTPAIVTIVFGCCSFNRFNI